MTIRTALRSLVRRWGLSLATILMLAVGIGATTAIYSVVFHLLIRPIPVDHPDRLVRIWKTRENLGFFVTLSPNEVEAVRKATQLEALEAYRSREVILEDEEAPSFVIVNEVGRSFFRFVNVTPLLGRPILPEDTRPGAPPVVLISYDFWTSRFAASRQILGRQIRIDRSNRQIVGVLPKAFRFPNQEADFWIPLDGSLEGSQRRGLNTLGLMRKGVSAEPLRQELDELLAGAAQDGEKWTSRIMGLEEMLGRRTVQSIWMLFAAVGLVLLISSANAANLIFLHGSSRTRQMVIRSALGARRRHLVGQILLESLLLSLAGGLGGLGLAVGGLDLIRTLRPENLAELSTVRVDQPVLSFCLGISLLVGVAAGLAPAFKLSRPDLASILRTIGRIPSAPGSVRLRKLLVGTEVALCLILLLGALLLIRGFRELSNADPGYQPEGLLAVKISLPEDDYPEAAGRKAFLEQAKQTVSRLPGVSGVSLGLSLPSQMGVSMGVLEIAGKGPVDDTPVFAMTFVDSDYFRIARIPVLSGRSFDPGEENVIVINRETANRFFPAGEAVGQRIRFRSDNDWTTVVGVVENVRAFGLSDSPDRPQLFYPYSDDGFASATLILRLDRETHLSTLAALVRERLQALDSRVPLREISSAGQLLSRGIARERFSTWLFSLFALVGISLAAIGLYGLVSFVVVERTSEFGIRLALGATRRDILWLLVRSNLGFLAGGLAAGLLGSYWFNRLLTSQLGDVSRVDAWAVGGAILILCAMVALAICLPARRSTRIDPLQALK